MHSTVLRPLTVALLSLALAGCADEEPRTEPLPPLPSVSSASTPSPTPSPSPPLTEVQAVEAAVRFYYEGFNRAWDKRDAQALAEGAVPGCKCLDAVAVTEQALSLGEVEGNRLTLASVQVSEVEGGTATATVEYSTTPGRVVGPDGQVAATLQSETKARRGVFLTRGEAGWLVVRVDVLSG